MTGKKITCFLFSFFLLLNFLQAQDTLNEKLVDTNYKENKGKVSVSARAFFMNTINKGDLADHTALGFGAGLKYETPSFKKFRLGIGGFAIYNVASTDLSSKDPLSGSANRYEIGLFDILDAGNKSNMYRLEELYLNYKTGKTSVHLGRQFLKTPFINLQDGRMRPTAEEGIWISSKDAVSWEFKGGGLWKISPRSTVKWFSVDKSIGLYPSGVDENGKPSGYKDNLQSGGVGMASIKYKKNNFSLETWDVLIENVLNTAMLQPEMEWTTKNGEKWITGLQFIFQHGVGNGGNADHAKRYVNPGSKAFVISSRIGVSMKKINTNINYTRITGDGRYLMPREWGREPFYTFMPRERNEGFGDVHAVSANIEYTSEEGTNLSVGYGHFYLPDVKNYRLNKYGFPSYNQFNMGFEKKLDKLISGLEFQLLLIYKGRLGESYNDLKYIDNKVNMLHGNLVINYSLNRSKNKL